MSNEIVKYNNDLNKISTRQWSAVEMKKNMSEDTMTIEGLEYTKSNECTNPSYFKKDDPYAWINFSDTGVAISSQHELGYVHLDYKLIKAIYTQMKELELIE